MSTPGNTQTGSASTAARESDFPETILCPECDSLGKGAHTLEYQSVERTLYYGDALGWIEKKFDGTIDKILLHFSTADNLHDESLDTESSQLMCPNCDRFLDFEWR